MAKTSRDATAPSPVLRVLRSPAEAPIAPIQAQPVAVLGFGNQGAAHALNLRDSGVEVVVGGRPGRSLERARSLGFRTESLSGAAACSRLVILGLPDPMHAIAWQEVAPVLQADAVVGVMHGFSLINGLLAPPAAHGVVLVAPKGPGDTLRRRFEAGQGIPTLFAVHQGGADPARTRAVGLAWAAGIGSCRAAIVETTVAIETETDLFGEQAVLCGGMSLLMEMAFQLLVDAGYPPEVAYMECCHEVKQVADLVYLHGPEGMRRRVSTTADFGAMTARRELDSPALRASMEALLAQVRSGAFARRFMDEAAGGMQALEASRRADDASPMAAAGAAVRAWIPWLRDEAAGR